MHAERWTFSARSRNRPSSRPQPCSGADFQKQLLISRMWVPIHRRPSFAFSRKRKRVAEESMPSPFLSTPVTEHLKCENVQLNGLEIGHASMQGYRVNMEDEHIIESIESAEGHTLVAVMDGHAGTFAAKFTSIEMRAKLEVTPQWQEYVKLSPKERALKTELISKALVETYVQLDKDLLLLDESGLMDESGCTCVCAVITPTHVVCANVGDSRCIVGSTIDGATVSLTDDHKPSNPEERARIEKVGAFVRDDRVNGELAMSRALGDFRYKRNAELQTHEHPVICYPDVAVHKRSGKGDQVLVLACDGVFDVMKNDEVVSYITEVVLADENSGAAKGNSASDDAKKGNTNTKAGKKGAAAAVAPSTAIERVSAQEAAESLIDLALSEGSMDNITAVIVKYL